MRRTLSSVTYRFLLMMVVMCLGLAVFAASALAATGGSISGVVYDSSEEPLSGVLCVVYQSDGGDGWYAVASTGSNDDGSYLVDYLADGDYRITFDAGDGVHAAEFYDGASKASLATTITITDSAPITDIDAHLSLGNAITGTVTDAPTGIGLQEITVDLYDAAGDWVDTRSTNADGVYEFQLVADGTYSVQFSDGWYGLYIEQFWNHRATAELADAIVVAGGETRSGIDADLTRLTNTGWGASISGTVSGVETGWSLPGVEVSLYVKDGASWSGPSATTFTDSLGRYLFTGLQPDEYTVRFDGANHVPEYFSDSPDLAGATGIVAGNDEIVTGKDAQLNLFLGAITGTLTDELTHEPIAGVYVDLYQEFGGWITSALTDSQGHYTLAGLWADNYRVSAYGYGAGYLPEYYQNETDWYKATLLSVDGTALTGIDMQLAVAGVISGEITGSDTGLAIPYASVALHYYADADDEWYWIDNAEADQDGMYEFVGLAYGTYCIRFTDQAGTYLPEYYQNAAGRLDATGLSVTAVPVVANGVLERGGSIACSVVDGTSGLPLEYTSVMVWRYESDSDYWTEFFDYNTWSYFEEATDASGECTITGLPYGTYRVSAYPSGYAQEFYEETATVDTATDIVVANATPVTGIAFTPSLTSTVAGRVTNTSGAPLAGCNVYLYRYDRNGEYWTGAGMADSTDANGDFVIVNVVPGTYRIVYSMTGYKMEYYPNQPTIWLANDVVVGQDMDITGCDTQLSDGASISGRVINTSAAAVFGYVRVLRLDPRTNNWGVIASQNTDGATGNYTFTGLPDGTYRIAVDASSYSPECYNNAPNQYSGTDVILQNDQDVVLNDIELAPYSGAEAGAIEGTVTADSGGGALSGITVYAHRAEPQYTDGWRYVGYTATASDGSYRFNSMAPGTYRLEFYDTTSRYLEEYFDDALAPVDAQLVSVRSGETTVCSAALARAASFSGKVVDDTTGDPIADTQVSSYKDNGIGWDYTGYSYTDYAGNYGLSGLTAGTYRLQFDEQYTYEWRPEFFDNVAAFSQAQDIVLSDGEQRTGLNASLARWGTIAGTVTDSTGGVLGQINMVLYYRTPDTWQEVDSTTTTEDGMYSFGHIFPGTYLVRAVDSGDYGFARYAAEYYQDATRTAAAQQIQMVSQAETVDFELDATDTWGSISGSVTDSYTADPIQRMYVQLYRWDDSGSVWTEVGNAVPTDNDGGYTIPWVPAAAGYRVGILPGVWGEMGTYEGTYRPTFHFDSPSLDGALDVTVTVGVETTGVDIKVAPEATTGYVTGHAIADGTGLPAPGVTVNCYKNMGGYFDYAGAAITAADGSFQRALSPGEYALIFGGWPNWADELYEDEDWYGDFYYANTVFVEPEASVEITASLEPYGSISGLVTASDTSEPIVDAYLDLYRETGEGWDWCSYSYSGTDGTYQFTGLEYDTYKVVCYGGDDDYAPQWYLGGATMNAATKVTVGPLSPDAIDFVLEPGATISGQVVDASSSAAIDSAYVEAYRYNEVTRQWDSGDPYTWTSFDGTYELRGLSAGTYIVYSNDGGHATQWFDGVGDWADATSIVLSAGQEATGTDFALEEFGEIRGTITDVRNGMPLQSASVNLLRWDSEYEYWAQWSGMGTNSSGQYSFTNIAPGIYRLYIYKGGFVDEYYDNRYGGGEEGQDIVVGDGQVRVVDMALSPGAPITGNVVNELSEGISGISVSALRWSVDAGQWVQVQTVSTGIGGSYTISGLGDGAYRVEFYDPTQQTYATQYFSGSSTLAAAQDVVVADGAPAAGVDATLTAYVAPGSGTLMGYVGSNADGSPVESVIVFASRYVAAYGGWTPAGDVVTDENGHYELSLEAGTYRLGFVDPTYEYLGEYYNNVYGLLWDANDITVTADATTTIDVSLAPSARIQGTVTDAGTGLPLPNVWVDVYGNFGGDWYWTAGASTAYDGTYDVYGMSPGEYYVEFQDYLDRYHFEYYDDTVDWDLATHLELGLSEVRTGIDAQLEPRGSISGTVTDSATGSPVSSARVTIWEDLEWGEYAWYSTATDENGHYEFPGVYNGSFLVSVDDSWYEGELGFARYDEMFYLQEPYIEDATSIEVMNSAETADFALSSSGQWGSISGKVVDSATGAPVSDMFVVLDAPDGLGGYVTDLSHSTYTAEDGTYQLNYVPLNSDPYRIVALPMDDLTGLYHVTFYPSAPIIELGGDVDLSVPAHLTNIDIAANPVDTVGWIEGLVVSEETSEPIAGIEVSFYDEIGNGGRTFTASDGTFTRAVAEGTYRLQFTDPGQGFLGEWYDDTDMPNASSVVATAGEFTSVTASLTPAARISGMVRNAFGVPIEADVVLYDSLGDYVNSVSTTPLGTYTFGELAAGRYSVEFVGWNGYASLWWNQQPTTGVADELVLTGGQVATSIDATLPMGAGVSGSVTSDDELLADPVAVTAYRRSGSEWLMMDEQLADPADDWYYEFRALLPGEYRFEYTGSYPTIWYGSVPTTDLATSVNLAPAQSAVVDQVLDGLPPVVGSDVAGPYSKKATIEISASDSLSGMGSIFYALDGGQTQEVVGESTILVVATAGDHSLEYWAEDAVGNPSEPVLVDFTVNAEVASTAIAGGTRYQTSVAVSEEAYPEGLDPDGDKTVVIATGRNWPDALGGSALAGVLDGPILLVDTISVPASVTDEIDRLGADKAIILGGTNAVSQIVEDTLESHLDGLDNVTRIAGGSRYETADLIAERVIAEQGGAWDHTAFVATGAKFPDALGAAPLAAANGWPLFLSHPINGLSTATKAKMAGVESVIVLGGESAVSTSVYNGLALAHADIVRLTGADRYDTAVTIATYGVEHAGLGWDKVAITTGTKFPDALAGGILQGKVGSVMVLTKPDVLNTYTKAALELHKDEIFSVTYLGGVSAVPQIIRDQVSAALMP